MFKKEKLFMSLVILMLVACVFGSVSSLATEITAGNKVNTTVITPITANTVNTPKNTANVVSITGTISNNTTNKTTNNTVNNIANSSSYEKTNSTKLPYAGSDSSVVFITLAFIASAIYAYKKVSEYNV